MENQPHLNPTNPHPQHKALHPVLERAYKIGVAVKGFDGSVELIAGVLLVAAPGLLHSLLAHVVTELQESQTTYFVAEKVARFDAHLAHASLFIVIIFLISHGVIKLALVYALLKELLWAYPYALGALGLFLVYQVYVFIGTPSVAMGLFAVLDILIIWLVWREWRTLKEEA